jgi:hypothetical protein
VQSHKQDSSHFRSWPPASASACSTRYTRRWTPATEGRPVNPKRAKRGGSEVSCLRVHACVNITVLYGVLLPYTVACRLEGFKVYGSAWPQWTSRLASFGCYVLLVISAEAQSRAQYSVSTLLPYQISNVGFSPTARRGSTVEIHPGKPLLRHLRLTFVCYSCLTCLEP